MSYKNDIKGYLRNNRKGKQANMLEKEAMHNRFLNDALDGYSSYSDDEQQLLLADLDMLQNRLQQRTEKKNRTLVMWWAAACIALLLAGGLGYRLLKTDAVDQQQMAVLSKQKHTTDIKYNKEEKVLIDSSSGHQSAQPARQKEEKQEQKEATQSNQTGKETLQRVEPIREHPIARAKSQKVEQKPQKQQHTISGTITDQADGSPLAFATIQVKNSKIAAVTNEDGTFKLNVPNELKEAELIISYLGFDSQELKANDSTYLAIALAPSASQLEEVVVTGYQTVKKQSITASIQTIKSDESEVQSTPTVGVRLIAKQGATPKMGRAAYKRQLREELLSLYKRTGTKESIRLVVSFTLDEEGYPDDIEILEYAGEPYDSWVEAIIDELDVWELPKNSKELKKPIRIRLSITK